MAQIQTKFIANAAITIPKLGTITDGITLDQSGSGSSLEIAPGGVSNTQVNASAAIAYSKLAALGGSTNAVLIQNGSGFVSPSAILSTNLFLADGSVAATGAFNLNSHQINNVSNPTSAQDAATKSYVDSVASGLFWQPPVEALASSNVPLTGSTPLVIDGYTVQNGDRLILNGQTTSSQNSLYTASITGGSYTLNLASPSPVVGDAYLVLNGTVYADSGFVYSTTNVFTQFASAPISYTAGAALTLTGHQFSVNVDNSTIDISGNNLEVKAGGITNTQVSASAAIAFSKLASLPSAEILVGNGSNVATAVPVSGDISLANTGAMSLVATSNATLTSLSALTSAANLATVGTITTGVWHGSTIAIANGGTGQTTAAAAFAALSPLTTAGDIIYENNTPAPARLPIGSTGQVLTVVAGLPAWSTAAASGVTTVGTFNSQASSANGLVISGSNIYAQAPTAANPGMVSVASSGTGLSLSTAALSVATDSATTKINGSNQVEALATIEQNITLASGDITNQFVDLAHAVYGTSASSNSIQLSVVGGPEQQKTVDYTVSLTGGSGGVTRITFAGDLATGGNAALVSGDILMIQYNYLI